MSRILAIDTCGGCPFSHDAGWDKECGHPGPMQMATVSREGQPPDWCPLPQGPVFQVKPLEWDEVPNSRRFYLSINERYGLRQLSDDSWRYSVGHDWLPCASREAGELACNEHHRERLADLLVQIGGAK